LLLSTGMAPVAVSATVHAAEVGTSVTSGAAHWRLGNVDRRAMIALGVPGFAGGVAGALLLSSLSAETARPFVAGILVLLGLVVLMRFAVPRRTHEGGGWRLGRLTPLGGAAGFLDASGGGGWGPVTMGTLMARPPDAPRRVIGTVNASEAATTVGATLGFLVAGAFSGVQLTEIAALMLGGMVVATPAAWLAKHARPRLLGIAVGGLLVLLNARTVGGAFGFETSAVALATLTALLVAGAAYALLCVSVRQRAARRITRAEVEHAVVE
jgi:uncharacterized protein